MSIVAVAKLKQIARKSAKVPPLIVAHNDATFRH